MFILAAVIAVAIMIIFTLMNLEKSGTYQKVKKFFDKFEDDEKKDK